MTSKLENWSVVELTSDPYTPPELRPRSLHGVIYDDSREKFPDGTFITTTKLLAVWESLDGRTLAVTNSGTLYQLNAVAEEYEALFPDARARLVKNFAERG